MNLKYLLILIFFWQCSAQESKIQDGEWIQLKISKNDTIIFKPCLDENRKMIIRNDSLIDFTGQEIIACKIKTNFERNDWIYIVLEENCSYSDTIAFKNYKNNLVGRKLYNNLLFFTTKKEFAKNYKTFSEKCADEDISAEKTINTHLFLSSFIKDGITSKNIISAKSKNIIESTVSK